MTTEVWLALFALLSSGGAALWMVGKRVIPKYVDARLDGARDRLDHQQAMEQANVEGLSSQRDAEMRLTLNYNLSLISTLERTLADLTTANETIRDRFFDRLDIGLNHIYGEIDGIRLEMRRMDANYSDLARDRHLLEEENDRRIEAKVDRLSEIVGRLVVIVQAAHGIEVQPEQPPYREGETD
jgi:hypothetical protein